MGEGVCDQIPCFAGVGLKSSEVFWGYSYTFQNDGHSIALFLEQAFILSSMDYPFVFGMLQSSG